MDEIRDFLTALGLERYFDVFSDNEITLAAVPHITDEDLKEIGLALGARRQVLSAAAKLQSTKLEPTSPTIQQNQNDQRISEAERRHLTVMFCDLVGSTELSRLMDPEDYRDLIRAYQDAVAGIITRYDGHIAKYMGDGVLTYFGFPAAHEDDAERAAQASLDILSAVKRISSDKPLVVRIGVASGLVVVGDIIGDAGSREEAVVGETPNLAARLQALALPDQVLFADTSHHLCRGRFEFEDQGSQPLKGFAEPVPVWHLVGERDNVSRFEAARENREDLKLTRFVGREDELTAITRRWSMAKSGRGQIALISGEAGIGKSRLLEAAESSFGDDGALRVRYQCSPFHEKSAYYPFIRHLTQAANLQSGEPSASALAKIAQLFPNSGNDVTKHVAAVAMMMSIELEGEYEAQAPNPQSFKQAVFDALLGQLSSISQTQTVLLIFEDLHWIDPSSMELLDQALRGSAELSVLSLLTCRPEFDAPWLGEANVANLVLNRLDAEQTTILAADLASEQLDQSTLQEIVSRADGIPLFAEELTRNLLEAQQNGEEATNIPATLQDILAARLDRTGDARETAQVGAVIGRDFSFDLLQASKTIPQSRLAGDLLTLEASGLISRRGQATDAVYTFKHALIQDAAYESLLRRRRQELHRQIAETIITHFPDRAEQVPQVLAQHFEAAGEALTAAHHWFDAGKQSVRLGEDGAGLVHYQQAIQLIESLNSAEDHAEFNLDCHIALSAAATFAYNANDPRKMEINLRASELCEIVKDDQRTFKVTWGRWYLEHFSGNDPVAAVETAKQLLAIGQRQNDRGFLLQGHHSAWTSTWSKEDLQATMDHADAGIRLYDVHEHRHHYIEFGGHDPGMCARNIGAMVHGFMGQLDTGQDLSDDAVNLGLEVDHVPSELMARGFGTTLLMFRREVDPLYAWIDDLEQLADHIEGPFDLFVATPRLIKGWTQAVNGQTDIGIAAIEHNLQMVKKSGFPKIGFQLMLLADAKRVTGEYDEALALLSEAKENGVQMNEQIWLSEIARVQANTLVGLNEYDAATVEYKNALEISSRQGALLLELRAARDLATLWNSLGRREEAYNLLHPIYERFDEGHDTPDLVESNILLNELA